MIGENALKACPFCGSVKHVHSVVRDGRSVGCGDCGATCHAYNPDSLRKAVAAWNTRSPVCEDAGEVVEALIRKWEVDWNHDEEAFDPDCNTCLILADLRALAKALEHKP